MLPEYLISEGDLPQEKLPPEGRPAAPPVRVQDRALCPSFWTENVPARPFFVRLELNREARHIVVRNARYTPVDLNGPPYYPGQGLLSAALRFFWGSPSSLGGELRGGEEILIDGVFLASTILLFQTTAAIVAAAPVAHLVAEVYYW